MQNDVAQPLPLEQHFAREDDTLHAAFGKRGSAHWMMGRPVPVPDPQATYAQLIAASGSGKRSVYVHIPFCVNHCLFCGFYRNRADESDMHDYVLHLLREIESDAARLGPAPIHTVYFGGGTPSALSAEDLGALVTAVRTHLPLAPDCEITIEGRVVGFGLDKIEACLAAGANRFSIGVQSFDTQLRRRFGRKAACDEIIAFMQCLQQTDRAAVVCDLIYGLPGQTMESWRQDIETCIALGLDGVDLYGLTLFEKGPLAQSIQKGALPAAADMAQMAHMYVTGLEMLANAGWRHLTQAHWASTTRERNLYNHYAKTGTDCLAFGAGAGGMLAGHRFMQDGDAATYRARVAGGEKPIAMMFSPMAVNALRNRITAGMELGYLNLAQLEQHTAPGLTAALSPLLIQWARAGLIRPRTDAVQLLPPGWFWQSNLSDSLLQLTMQYLHKDEQPHSQGLHHVH